MLQLVAVGESLLKKKVSKINLKTGLYEFSDSDETNEEALRRYTYYKMFIYNKHLTFVVQIQTIEFDHDFECACAKSHA